MGTLNGFANKIVNFVTGQTGQTAPVHNYSKYIQEGGIGAIVGGVVLCCVIAGLIGITQFLKFQPPIAPPTPAQAAGPQVKASRKKTKATTDEGVSMSNLLSASDIRAQLEELR